MSLQHVCLVGEPVYPGEPFSAALAEWLEPEPRGMALLAGALLALCLAIGLYPGPLLATIADVIRGLTFIQPL